MTARLLTGLGAALCLLVFAYEVWAAHRVRTEMWRLLVSAGGASVGFACWLSAERGRLLSEEFTAWLGTVSIRASLARWRAKTKPPAGRVELGTGGLDSPEEEIQS